jgi:hypothetical protein
MKKLHGIFLAVFAFSAMALMVGCSGGGASSEDEIKEDMSNIDKGLEGVPELPEDAKQGPLNPKMKGGGAPAGTTGG